MLNHWTILLIMALSIFSASMIANKLAKGDLPSIVFWSLSGAIPGTVLLIEASAGYMLITILFVAIALWRSLKVKRNRENSVSVSLE